MAKTDRDYYELLGIDRDATPSQVKRAFLAKARVMHPDVSSAPDAEERFKEINEAYSVLSDPKRRENYDRFGDPDGPGGFTSMDDFFGGFDMADLMSEFFGASRAGGQGRRQRRGRDMAARLSVSLREAATGTARTIAYDRLSACDDCGGTGSSGGEPPVSCPVCGGTGRQVTWQNTILGRMQTQVPCPQCGGSGTIVEHPCETCDGQGRVPSHEVVEIEVPVGARTGETLRLAGLGEAGWRGSPTGDLVVELLVEDDPRFRRSGDDLVQSLEVDALEAILGCEIEVEGILPEESFVVEVPPSSLEGSGVRVDGRGMPRRSGHGRGDFVGVVSVHAPEGLSDAERDELRRMSIAHGGRVRPAPASSGTGARRAPKHARHSK